MFATLVTFNFLVSSTLCWLQFVCRCVCRNTPIHG